MRKSLGPVLQGILAATLWLAVSPAHALVITPNFDASITGNVNAAQVEGAINQAIATLDGLYSNAVTLSVDFTYTNSGTGNLLGTSQYYYGVSYASYVARLTADASANPGNTVLAEAIANLHLGNDANGAKQIALSSSLFEMLGYGVPATPNPVININSIQNFSFTDPTGSSQFDLIGGLEHELDEVLGGGGGGSTLNNLSNSFFSDKVGPLDLYRYSAANTPSYTTSGSANSYLSIDGGTTSIVVFNQNSNGDYADFAPNCGGVGGYQYIQNAFNCLGPYETYTSASPEYTMMQAIGWNPFASSGNALPEPGSSTLFAIGIAAMSGVMRKRGKHASPANA